MKLEDYIKTIDGGVQAFAKKIGASRMSVYRYIKGERLPNKIVMEKIQLESNGAVMPQDFFNITTPIDNSLSIAAQQNTITNQE